MESYILKGAAGVGGNVKGSCGGGGDGGDGDGDGGGTVNSSGDGGAVAVAVAVADDETRGVVLVEISAWTCGT